MAEDLTTLQTRLTEARAALHSLSIGQQVVEIQRDGRRMKYGSADSAALADYIRDLENQIADIEGAVVSARPRRRFIPVAFG